MERWVVNLTDRALTPVQEGVLKLGLKFAPAPTSFPMVDTTAAVEEAARELKVEEADDLQGRVCGILRCAKLPADNMTREQRKMLKELRGLDNQVILPADKGNATVVIKKEDYDTKIRGLLGTSTYRQLERDPTVTQENRLGHKLKGLEKCGEILGHLYRMLRSSGSQPSRIYRLSKIHKPDAPLRPIVSCIGSPSYQLSKHITSILTPLTGQTESKGLSTLHTGTGFN